jgi:hypothetical protein
MTGDTTMCLTCFVGFERKLATQRRRPRFSAKGPRAKLLFANKGGQWPFIIPKKSPYT